MVSVDLRPKAPRSLPRLFDKVLPRRRVSPQLHPLFPRAFRMYYLTLLLAITAAVVAARLCVGLVARIGQRWVRRIVFWLLVVPGALIVCGRLFVPVSDDMYMRASPSHVIIVGAPLLAFVLSLIGCGLFGFRSGAEPGIPRAKGWKTGRAALQSIALWPLLILSLFLFDLELQYRLRSLKAKTLETWTSIELPTVADDDNAAVSYAALKNWTEAVTKWHDGYQDEYAEFSIEDVDFADEQLILLTEECEPAFEVIRMGSRRPSFQLRRDRTSPDLYAKDESLELLRRGIQLFYINLLARAHRGEIAEAYSDTQVLLRLAKQLDSDVRRVGRMTAMLSRQLAKDSVQRLLQIDPQPDQEHLVGLIDEQHNPRETLAIVFAWTEAEHVTAMCNHYLWEISEDEQDDLYGPDVQRMPGPIKYLVRMTMRVSSARDDLIATRFCSDVYASFAARYEDPTATSDALVARLGRRIPLGTISRVDPRDVLYHWTLASNTDQQLINLMVAATQFHRQHARFPKELTELVPDYLSSVPICGADGNPIRRRPLGNGLVIYGERDEYTIDKDFEELGSVRRHNAIKYLHSSVFLGEAFERVFRKPVPYEDEAGAWDDFQFESLDGDPTLDPVRTSRGQSIGTPMTNQTVYSLSRSDSASTITLFAKTTPWLFPPRSSTALGRSPENRFPVTAMSVADSSTRPPAARSPSRRLTFPSPR